MIEDIALPTYVKHVRYADFRNWRDPNAYRLSFLEVLRAMQIEPRLLGPEEFKWYVKHRAQLKGVNTSLRTICGQLYGALYSNYEAGKPVHYLMTEDVFEESKVISKLDFLASKILSDHRVAHLPRLSSLRENTLKSIQYAKKELPRSSYEDTAKVDNFMRLVGTVVNMLDQIAEEVEIALFASIKIE